MRRLTTGQKETIMHYVKTKHTTQEVKDELLKKLEEINDYETLWSDMERFINDYEYSYDCSSDGHGGRYILDWRKWS